MSTPELSLPLQVSETLHDVATRHDVEQIEARVLDSREALAAEIESPSWRTFISEFSQAWRSHDHVLVRGLPMAADTTTILVALALDSPFKPYRGDKVVKHFKMSPWTTELSQTLREGHFHTDLSTAERPPRVTVVHCRVPDPSPGFGAVHVARLVDILASLDRREAAETLRFLLEDEVQMVDDRARGAWSGVMVSGEEIRFHPETLRAAVRRGASFGGTLERHLSLLHEIALEVSSPIELESGDALFVSNTRALHYRGACTVRYLEFPRSFEAREIYVLHLRDEPTWPK